MRVGLLQFNLLKVSMQFQIVAYLEEITKTKLQKEENEKYKKLAYTSLSQFAPKNYCQKTP